MPLTDDYAILACRVGESFEITPGILITGHPARTQMWGNGYSDSGMAPNLRIAPSNPSTIRSTHEVKNHPVKATPKKLIFHGWNMKREPFGSSFLHMENLF